MESTVPPLFTAVLLGAIALYGSLSVVITHLLRLVIPAESGGARVLSVVVAAGLAIWAAYQHAAPILPGLPPAEQALAIVGYIGAVWWASQEVYRRIHADAWPTKADPYPPVTDH